MQYVLLMILPMAVSALGGGMITDESANKRVLGFVLVGIACIGIIALIVWQIIDPNYYVLDLAGQATG